MADEYEVGYRKPPKQHRFQPGNQAARKGAAGKKKRAPEVSLSSIVADVLRARRKAKRGDAIISFSVGEILRERLITMIVSGTAGEVVTAMRIMERLLPQGPAPEPEPLEVHLHRADGSKVPLPTSDLWQGASK